MVAKPLRAALYGREPDGVVAAALRIKGLLDLLPDGALALRGNERAAVEALSAAAEAMPDADTALDHAARRLGARSGENWRAAIMTHEWRMDDGGGARPLPPGRGDSSPPGIRHAIVHGDESFEGPEYKLQSAAAGDDRADTQTAQAAPSSVHDASDAPFDENAATDADRDDDSEGADLLFRRYRENLGPTEGGKANRSRIQDRGGPTNKGISQETLNDLRKKPEWSHLPQSSFDLSDEQIDLIYKREYFDRPRIHDLARIPGLEEAAPQMAEQVFDSGVLHRTTRGGRFLQQAIDEVMGTDLKESDPRNPRAKVYDGIVGPKTREAVAQAIEEGKIKEVNNRMVDIRIEFMKQQPNFKFNSGWIPRAESFRIKE